jgi:cell division septum initiation protein DivIVA
MEPGMANGERTVDGLLERVAKVEAANAELVSLNARLQAWAAESERLRTTLDLDAKSLRSWAEANESRVAGLRARIAELESSRGDCPTTPPGAAR